MSSSAVLLPPEMPAYAERVHEHEATILRVTAMALGVHVNEGDVAYWRAGAKLAAALDSLVDEGQQTDVSEDFHAVTQGQPIGPPNIIGPEEAREISRVHANLSDPRRQAWSQCLRLPEFAARKAQARTIDDLIDVTLEESMMFSGAFQLDTDGTRDAEKRAGFNDWLTHFARAAYMIDSALDLPADFKHRLINVPPTKRNRAAMLLAARPDIIEGSKIPPRALVELGKTALATVQERGRTVVATA
jgi:hypothetical protein